MKKINDKSKYIILLIVILFLVLLHLYIQTKSITLKYEGTNLKIKLKDIKIKNRILASMLAKEESLYRIEKRAKEELGMSYPKDINYIIIREENKK
ncbi:hypothetical protein A3J90_00480 [candidate division WOR-1 bacterium RIFOXYC2_FULL_37_10]|uniref:Cell division protein FtsL n=1 Tax=candidate division WOR-1 bacterium RIFOXYB2_FULL_37_13 TaxID=1802579 RepID=A0A1F4SMT5_UNCSA|nr:MAG: hypothetical protein A2310_00365 [candidate division WOR-1 bacterium RIFOXYB2_FULL_37_13]OGC32606.1 MAG: hypothetical protein A3J90_00480 [candidate division WOR-1 bacterium RIFOXYC2_FULL_37_10]